MIRRTFLYRNYGKQSEDHFQATLAVVGAAIAKVSARTRKTKQGLKHGYPSGVQVGRSSAAEGH